MALGRVCRTWPPSSPAAWRWSSRTLTTVPQTLSTTRTTGVSYLELNTSSVRLHHFCNTIELPCAGETDA